MKESEKIAASDAITGVFCEKRKLLESKLILERSMLNNTFESVAHLKVKLTVFVLRNENCYIQMMLLFFSECFGLATYKQVLLRKTITESQVRD